MMRQLAVVFSLILLPTAGAASAGIAAEARPESGQWQPGGVFTEPAAELAPATSRFLLLDTGGSGGMFGKGDIRSDLLDVAFWSDGRHGAASGKAGVFFTDDGGLSWRRSRQHPRREYPAEGGIQYPLVELAGPREIWAVETRHPAIGQHIWHSADAGATWDDAALRLPDPLKSVWDLLVRGQHVWILGGREPTGSFRSDDGGKTWRRLALPRGFEPFIAVTPASDPIDSLGTLYLLGARREQRARIPCLLRSDDQGASWQEIALPDPQSLPWAFNRATINFATPDAGLIGLDAPGFTFKGPGKWEKHPDASASVLVTRDGGQSWARRELPGEELHLTALWHDPVEPDHAFAGVWNGFVAQRGAPRDGPALYETLDAGAHWTPALRGRLQINAIVGLTAQRLWAVGDKLGGGANDVVAIVATPGPTQ